MELMVERARLAGLASRWEYRRRGPRGYGPTDRLVDPEKSAPEVTVPPR